MGRSQQASGASGADGEEEQARTTVRGSGVRSAQARPLRVIPELGQVAEDFAEAPVRSAATFSR